MFYLKEKLKVLTYQNKVEIYLIQVKVEEIE
jgi:hypothetical protein